MADQSSARVRAEKASRPVFLQAAAKAVPIALGVGTYGLVFGVLARQAGLDLWQGLFMSAWVFAGASQFVALDLWISPLPVTTLIITALVVNLRHILMGAALAPKLMQLGWLRAHVAVFFIADENWALTMGSVGKNPGRGGRFAMAWLVGGGSVMYTAWVGSTLLGQSFGGLVEDPARWGLDFAFSAAFIALLVGFWRGKSDLLPWLVAALVSVVCYKFLPGKWYILIGGLAGSLAGPLAGRPRHGE